MKRLQPPSATELPHFIACPTLTGNLALRRRLDANLPHFDLRAFGLDADHTRSFVALGRGVHELAIDDDFDGVAEMGGCMSEDILAGNDATN